MRTRRGVEFIVLPKEEKPSLRDKLRSVFSSSALTIVLASMMSTGSTFSFTNNLGQLATSFSFHKKRTQNLVALLGILKFFGLIGGHLLSSIPLMKRAKYRTKAIMLTVIMCGLGYFILALKGKDFFFFAASVDAVTSGVESHLLYSLIPDVFEIPVEGIIFPLSNFGAVSGNIVLSSLMAALYDRQAKIEVGSKGLGGGSTIQCIGVDCYRLSLIVITLVKFLSVLPYLRVWKKLKS